MIFFLFFSRLRWFWTTWKKNVEKILIFFFCLERIINTKKHMLPFSSDVKNYSSIFFFRFQGLSERMSVILILIPEVWTKEMKLHISYSKNYDLFIPFWPGFGSGSTNLCGSGSGPGKNMQIRVGPDPKPWNYTSERITSV